MIMYGFATPTYDDDKDDWDESLDANNPENFKGASEGVVTNPFKGIR